MEFSFEVLKDKIEEQAKTAFTEIYEKHKDEKIYAFALYSDEGAMTVCTAVNTLTYFAEAEDPEDLGYKFSSSEWKYEGYGADDLTREICKTLYNELMKNSDNDEWFDTFQKQLYDTCIAVLIKLKKEGFFKKIVGDDIFLMFSVTDYEFEKADEVAIVTSLNDNQYRDEYLAWMETWSN
jgi:Domain of unknown function (DUF4303)